MSQWTAAASFTPTNERSVDVSLRVYLGFLTESGHHLPQTYDINKAGPMAYYIVHHGSLKRTGPYVLREPSGHIKEFHASHRLHQFPHPCPVGFHIYKLTGVGPQEVCYLQMTIEPYVRPLNRV